jgi:hypothetical protein
MQIRLTTLTLITTLAVPYIAQAGGPIITEEPPIADVRPQGDGGSWVVPVIVGALIVGAILIGSDNCNSGEPTDGCR